MNAATLPRETLPLMPNVNLKDMARRIGVEWKELGAALTSSIERAVRIGGILVQVKATLKHGEFVPWVEKNCSFKRRHASNFMRLAELAKRATIAHLNQREALKLLAAPACDNGNGQPAPPAPPPVQPPVVPPPPVVTDDLPPVVPPLESPPAMPVDELGTPLPSPEITHAFARRPELNELYNQVSRVKKTVLDGIEADDPLYTYITPSQFEADGNNFYHWLKLAKPYAVCPYCGGGGCKACRARGWVNKTTYEHAPSETKV